MAETLGSYNDFLAVKGYEHGPKAMHEYSVALDGLRAELAAQRGISVEDLHFISNVSIRPESAA